MQEIIKIIKYTKELRFYYAAIAVLVVIIALANLINPFLIRELIDLITAQSTDKSLSLYDAAVPLTLMLATGILTAILANINGYLGDRMSEKLNSLLATRYYDQLMNLPIAYFDNEQTGKITARLERSIFGLSQLMNALANNFVQFFLTSLVTLVAIAIYSWPVALLLAVIFPTYIWISHLSSNAWQKKQAKINKLLDSANGRFVESIGQIRVVKSYVKENAELKRFSRYRKQIEAIDKDQSVEWHGYDAARRAALALVFFAIFCVIVWQALGGVYSIGTAVLLITLANQAQFPLFTASFIIEGLQRAKADSRDYFKVMELKHDIADIENAKNIKVANGQISFRNVRFSYHTNSNEILKSVNFEIDANSKVALVGESGEGKSTIANLIARFYEADSGEILVDNQNIKTVTQSSLRSQIGIVFQDPSLFSGTIEENIVYGLGRRHTMKEVETVAKLANAADFIKKLDQGYKTQVGERGIKLSGGQKQRIIIARALLKNPPILILDEATSSLDAKAESQVQQALERLMKDRTTIIIAHRLSTIAHVDQIIGLRGGKIVEQGSPSELAHKTGGIYAELLKLQTASAQVAKKKLKKFDISG